MHASQVENPTKACQDEATCIESQSHCQDCLGTPLGRYARGRSLRMTVRAAFICSYEFAEHFFGVDGDEDAAAAGEDFILLVEDFGDVDVLAAVDADFPALDAQRFVERDGLEVFDRHLFGEGDDVVELVYLAHGVVEDGGDDAAVAVAGRSGVALAEAEIGRRRFGVLRRG